MASTIPLCAPLPIGSCLNQKLWLSCSLAELPNALGSRKVSIAQLPTRLSIRKLIKLHSSDI